MSEGVKLTLLVLAYVFLALVGIVILGSFVYLAYDAGYAVYQHEGWMYVLAPFVLISLILVSVYIVMKAGQP